MREPSTSPVAAGALFPELLGTAEPPPPVRPRWSRLLRGFARVALWSLVAIGAFRGLVPAGPADPPGPGPVAPIGPPEDRQAAATATAAATVFLREYLTVGHDRAARAERLGQLTVAGVDLRDSVSVPDGVAQYADLVVASSSAPVPGGIEVTVLAHVLQLRSGAYRDAGTLAFVVPLAVRREGLGVRGPPRPANLPISPGSPLPRPPATPPELARSAGAVARRAVVALGAGDREALTDLGGGRPPSTRPFPSGWRTLWVGDAEVTGPAGAISAEVPVRVQPPTGRVSYVAPVRVQLEAGPRGLAVRHIDSGGSA